MAQSYNVGGITLWNVGTLQSPVIQGIGGVPFSHSPGGYIQFSDADTIIDNSCLCSYRAYRVFRVTATLTKKLQKMHFIDPDATPQNPYATFSDAGLRWLLEKGFRYVGCRLLPDLKWHYYSQIPYNHTKCNVTTAAPLYYLLEDKGPATVLYMDIPSYKCCNGYSGCGHYKGGSDGTGRLYTKDPIPVGPLHTGWWCNALFIVTFSALGNKAKLIGSGCTQHYFWTAKVLYLSCDSARVIAHNGFNPDPASGETLQLCKACILSLYRDALTTLPPACSQWYLYSYSLPGCSPVEGAKWSLVKDYTGIPASIMQGGGGCCPDNWHTEGQLLKICNLDGSGGTLYVWVKGGLCGKTLLPPYPENPPTGNCSGGCHTQKTAMDSNSFNFDRRPLSDSSCTIWGSDSRDSMKDPCILVSPPPYRYLLDTVEYQMFDVYRALLTLIDSALLKKAISKGASTCYDWYKIATTKDPLTGLLLIDWKIMDDDLYDWLVTGHALNYIYTEKSKKYLTIIVPHEKKPTKLQSKPSNYSGILGFNAVQDRKGPNRCELLLKKNNPTYYFQVYFTGCSDSITSFSCLKWRYVGRFNSSKNDLCKMGIQTDTWLPNIGTNVLLPQLLAGKAISVYTVAQHLPKCCEELPEHPSKQVMCCYLILQALCLIPQKLAISKAIEKGAWSTLDVSFDCGLSLTMKFGLVDLISKDNNQLVQKLSGLILPCTAYYSYKLGLYWGDVRALDLIKLAKLCSSQSYSFVAPSCPSNSALWRLKTKDVRGVYFSNLCMKTKYMQYYFQFKGSLRCYYDPLAVKEVLPVILDPVIITPLTQLPLTGWFLYSYIGGVLILPQLKVINVPDTVLGCPDVYYTNYKIICNEGLVSLSLSGYSVIFPLRCCNYLCKSRYRLISIDDLTCETKIGGIVAGELLLCSNASQVGRGYYYTTKVDSSQEVPQDSSGTLKPSKCNFYYVASKKWRDFLLLPLDQSLSLTQVDVAWSDSCLKWYKRYDIGSAVFLLCSLSRTPVQKGDKLLITASLVVPQSGWYYSQTPSEDKAVPVVGDIVMPLTCGPIYYIVTNKWRCDDVLPLVGTMSEASITWPPECITTYYRYDTGLVTLLLCKLKRATELTKGELLLLLLGQILPQSGWYTTKLPTEESLPIPVIDDSVRPLICGPIYYVSVKSWPCTQKEKPGVDGMPATPVSWPLGCFDHLYRCDYGEVSIKVSGTKCILTRATLLTQGSPLALEEGKQPPASGWYTTATPSPGTLPLPVTQGSVVPDDCDKPVYYVSVKDWLCRDKLPLVGTMSDTPVAWPCITYYYRCDYGKSTYNKKLCTLTTASLLSPGSPTPCNPGELPNSGWYFNKDATGTAIPVIGDTVSPGNCSDIYYVSVVKWRCTELPPKIGSMPSSVNISRPSECCLGPLPPQLLYYYFYATVVIAPPLGTCTIPAKEVLKTVIGWDRSEGKSPGSGITKTIDNCEVSWYIVTETTTVKPGELPKDPDAETLGDLGIKLEVTFTKLNCLWCEGLVFVSGFYCVRITLLVSQDHGATWIIVADGTNALWADLKVNCSIIPIYLEDVLIRYCRIAIAGPFPLVWLVLCPY